MVTHWQHLFKKDLSLMASPIKLSATSVRTDLPPLLGQHTDEVLRSVLNDSNTQLAELKKKEVI